MEIGEVWKIKHSRKGEMTIKLLSDPCDVTCFEAEIIDGSVGYASNANRLAQKYTGLGTAGDTITLRKSLTQFLERIQ